MTTPIPPAGQSKGNTGNNPQGGFPTPPQGSQQAQGGQPGQPTSGQSPYAQQQPPAGYPYPPQAQGGQNPYAQQQPPAGYPYPPQAQGGQNPYAQQQPPAGYPYPPQAQGGQNPYAQQQPPAGYPYPPQAQGGQPGPPQPEVVTEPIGSFGRSGQFTTKIKIPAHALKFDENVFLKLLAGSISLTKDEKKRIIEAVPNLTQFQVDELIRILNEEKSKFSALDVKHKEQLRGLEGKHSQEWEELEFEMTAGVAKQEEENNLAKARAATAALNQKK